MLDPQPDFHPVIGTAETLSAGLRRILAPNPSPMTFRGTNTYVLGTTDLAVIDPGPDNSAHLTAILDSVQPGQRITHILVTHAHLDHSPLAPVLAAATGAKVYGYGRAEAGRSPMMQKLAASGCVGGGEGVDTAFCPDIEMTDEQVVAAEGWSLTALHTPGHMSNHLSFAWGNTLFSGDLVMGWASSLVSPPDGDLGAFMASLERLSHSTWSVFHAGHGAPVQSPNARLQDLIQHRRMREAAIISALGAAPSNAADLAVQIYTDTPKALLGAAARNVLAHLVDLTEKSKVEPLEALSETAVFRII